MYHYNFTNDLRISNLDEILKEAAQAFLTDSVPNATEDKSRNNNYNTVGSYFNLKAKGTCANLASNGNTRKVVLNFIKKFQFPNTRTQTDFENAKKDGILLAPMRDIVKLLYILSFINQEQAYLSKEEIKNFIFYNDDVAKRKNYNLINTANQIIQFRRDKELPSNINTVESEYIWNQPERQLREMLKTLNYTNCFTEDDNKIYFNAKKLTRDNEADLFEIINCNTYWQGNTNEEYQKYMDDIELSDEEKNMNTKISKIIPSSLSLNRIIFGAPGTGKSFLLNKEARESNFAEITRVTFHPDYSYSQFVGTYKPAMVKSESKVTDENVRKIIEILQDKTKTAQEKYDLLYDKFKSESDLTRLPVLVGLYCDETFTTRKQDGTTTANNNSVEINHGKAIRPYVNLKSQNDSEEISYKYVPGPFLRTLVAALKSGKSGNPQNYLLIVEEINRAKVAAVFGDMFQLLDRNANGESDYEIQTSEDMRNYLAEQLGGNSYNYKALKLPNNFYIWATMNSTDQGVFPMDTAFKRRWNFEYIGINDNENGVSSYEIPINKSKKVNWNDLRKAINSKLISLNVNEDKLLGPYFISENDLKNAMGKPEDFIKLFKSKVLMYLFEDAAKMKRDFFKLTDNRKYIYSDICKELDENGIAVFNFLENEKVEETKIPEKVQNDGEKIVGSSPTMTEKTKIESSVSPLNDGTN